MEKIEELLMMLANPNIPLATKQKKFHDWKLFFYSPDAVHEFFSDSLFRNNGETNYLDIMLGTNYKDFYEMVMSLDLANMDPKAYYIYWILTYGNDKLSAKFIKEALDFDGDTIRGIFPDIEKVLFDD